MSRSTSRVAIVSGGARGLGAAIVRRLCEDDLDVVIAGGDEASGSRLEHEIVAAGGRARYARLDVRDDRTWQEVVASTIDRTGRVDILVNNAGVSSTAYPVLGDDPLDTGAWRGTNAVNVDGLFLGCRAVIPLMQRQGLGCIVNVGSISGRLGIVEASIAYTASKTAVSGLTRALAVRYGPDGIRVNTVLPGLMPPMRGATRSGDQLDLSGIPLRRVGTGRDAAAAVSYLCSDDASYVTGVDLVVDGGASVQFRVALPPTTL